MKRLHRPDLFAWSSFDESRNIDFSSVAWIRAEGNVLIDPLPMTEHDRAHLLSLGGASHIVVTNSDHTQGAQGLAQQLSATLYGPRAERERFPVAVRPVARRRRRTGARLAHARNARQQDARRTCARAGPNDADHRRPCARSCGGRTEPAPDAKLADRARALASVKRIVDEYPQIETVLVGDGWPVFHDGARALAAIAG